MDFSSESVCLISPGEARLLNLSSFLLATNRSSKSQLLTQDVSEVVGLIVVSVAFISWARNWDDLAPMMPCLISNFICCL